MHLEFGTQQCFTAQEAISGEKIKLSSLMAEPYPPHVIPYTKADKSVCFMYAWLKLSTHNTEKKTSK